MQVLLLLWSDLSELYSREKLPKLKIAFIDERGTWFATASLLWVFSALFVYRRHARPRQSNVWSVKVKVKDGEGGPSSSSSIELS
jgi:hypothetical protein